MLERHDITAVADAKLYGPETGVSLQIRSATWRRVSWLWALLPLLLAAALAIPLLDVDAFNGDEPPSLHAAGILRSRPTWSLVDVWIAVKTAPRHAPGWPLLLSIWGRIVGWSAAIRALSLFIGLLALAWVYRAGRDFFAPAAGLCCAVAQRLGLSSRLHGTSATFYALVALRRYLYLVLLARSPCTPGGRTQAGLLLGSIGLLYSHYLGTAAARPRPVSSALRPEEPALVASGAPLRPRHRSRACRFPVFSDGLARHAS